MRPSVLVVALVVPHSGLHHWSLTWNQERAARKTSQQRLPRLKYSASSQRTHEQCSRCIDQSGSCFANLLKLGLIPLYVSLIALWYSGGSLLPTSLLLVARKQLFSTWGKLIPCCSTGVLIFANLGYFSLGLYNIHWTTRLAHFLGTTMKGCIPKMKIAHSCLWLVIKWSVSKFITCNQKCRFDIWCQLSNWQMEQGYMQTLFISMHYR